MSPVSLDKLYIVTHSKRTSRQKTTRTSTVSSLRVHSTSRVGQFNARTAPSRK